MKNVNPFTDHTIKPRYTTVMEWRCKKEMKKKVTVVFLLTASIVASIAGSAFAASVSLPTEYRTPIIKIVPPDPYITIVPPDPYITIVPPDPYIPIIKVVPPDPYRN